MDSSYDITTPILAGYMAGGVSMLIHHPLDSLKVLRQTENSTVSKSATTVTTSTTATPATASSAATTTATSNVAATSTNTSSVVTRNLSTAAVETPSSSQLQVSKRSIRSLYAGLTGPLVSVGLVQSLNFALYDSFRKYLYSKDHPNNNNNKDYLYKDSLSNVLCSSLATGFCITFVTSPVFVMKTKQQLTGKSFFKTLKSTINHPAGFKNFYVGLGPHMICETVWRGCYFTAYEHLKRQVSKFYDEPIQQPLPLPHTVACAGVAGAFAWAIMFPVDVVRSRMYAQAAKFPNHPDPLSSLQMAKSLWKEAGFKLFYRGIFVNILRLTPMQMTLLPCYDLASQILATSSL